MRRKRRHGHRRSHLPDQASYVCDCCGEEIVIPIDASEGHLQEYVEECPVCCFPIVIRVEIDSEGSARAWGNSEQDLA